jgi:hypothetical protein
MDSVSGRLQLAAHDRLALQVSAAHLEEAEAGEGALPPPRRRSRDASAMYQGSLANGPPRGCWAGARIPETGIRTTPCWPRPPSRSRRAHALRPGGDRGQARVTICTSRRPSAPSSRWQDPGWLRAAARAARGCAGRTRRQRVGVARARGAASRATGAWRWAWASSPRCARPMARVIGPAGQDFCRGWPHGISASPDQTQHDLPEVDAVESVDLMASRAAPAASPAPMSALRIPRAHGTPDRGSLRKLCHLVCNGRATIRRAHGLAVHSCAVAPICFAPDAADTPWEVPLERGTYAQQSVYRGRRSGVGPGGSRGCRAGQAGGARQDRVR